jgi:DNA-binding response OmpR family regulator
MALVLIADDGLEIRELVQFQELTGFEAAATGDGVTAMALARSQPPDVATLDVSIPELSGLDVCRLLRANTATAGTRIILRTAQIHGHGHDLEARFGVGADDYLPASTWR